MITAKRQPIDSPQPAAKEISGKYVIIAVVTVALTGAVASWYFRYNATHRAAEFWGPEAARLIRDAGVVQYSTFSKPVVKIPARFSLVSPNEFFDPEPQSIRDVTTSHGLVHLRQALLEDRSFEWPAESLWDTGRPEMKCTRAMIFIDESTGRKTYLLFSPDSQLITTSFSNQVLSYKPIAAGIDEMFAEFETVRVTDAAKSSR